MDPNETLRDLLEAIQSRSTSNIMAAAADLAAWIARDGFTPTTIPAMLAAPDLLAALEECITEDGARCMVDETRHAANICRDRLAYISSLARAAIKAARGQA